MHMIVDDQNHFILYQSKYIYATYVELLLWKEERKPA